MNFKRLLSAPLNVEISMTVRHFYGCLYMVRVGDSWSLRLDHRRQLVTNVQLLSSNAVILPNSVDSTYC